MRIVAAILTYALGLASAIWGTLAVLAVIGFFTQIGPGIRERGTRSFFANAAGFGVLFVAPLTAAASAIRLLRP